MEAPLGNLSDNSLEEIWNSERMRGLRVNMLSGKRSLECTRCYQADAAGNHSKRQAFNQEFIKNFDDVEKSRPDGTVEDFKMRYLDIRFSNICNFRCRSCGPQLSSAWYEDSIKLYGDASTPQRIIRPSENPADFWQQLEAHIPYIETANFAGGEPLLMEEHYMVLNKLIAHGSTDISLIYNTNFSVLKFQSLSVLELWQKFKDVYVGASLDAEGKRGEYLRKGQDWAATIENRKSLLRACPHVVFSLAPTVSLMNALALPDLHQSWLEQGLVKVNDIMINLLMFPEYYSVQVLPPLLKKRVEERYFAHITYLKQNYADVSEATVNAFASVLTFMNARDLSSLVPEFLEQTAKLDQIRKEDFFSVFPELADLKANTPSV